MTTGRLIRRTSLGLLLLLVVVIAGACKVIGPTDFDDLRVATDNAGPKEVSVTVTDSGPGMTSNGVTPVAPGGNLEVVVPLAATWEVKVDGTHVIGSGDRTDLALPSPGQRQDLLIHIQVAADGTVTLLDAHYIAPGEVRPQRLTEPPRRRLTRASGNGPRPARP